MYKGKWYLETWLICICFLFSFLLFPFVIGVTLLVLQIIENKNIVKKYAESDQLDRLIYIKQNQANAIEEETLQRYQKLQTELEENYMKLKTEYGYEAQKVTQQYQKLQTELEENYMKLKTEYGYEAQKVTQQYQKLQTELEAKYSDNQKELEEQRVSLIQDLNDLTQEYEILIQKTLVEHYKLSEYSSLSSEECRNQLSLLKTDLQNLIKESKAVNVSSYASRRTINDNVKQIIRCFNTECDNILYNITAKNIDAMRTKMTKSFETLNKIFQVDGMQLTREFLEYKLNELNLVYSYEVKREQEKEIQRAIKEQMMEEEKIRREIEKQKAKIEKDQQQCSGEINKLTAYLRKTENDAEKQLYIDKIRELEAKIKELETEKDEVLEREANAKAGYVYIISNIGSFGDDIYKIGMTRRLEPMDRIKELSSASVPFEFDVHAMIFSNDAPDLETALHKHFEKNSVNKINLRKEFFKVSLDEIEEYVKQNYNNTVHFTKVPVATEYRQTLQIIASNE